MNTYLCYCRCCGFELATHPTPHAVCPETHAVTANFTFADERPPEITICAAPERTSGTPGRCTSESGIRMVLSTANGKGRHALANISGKTH